MARGRRKTFWLAKAFQYESLNVGINSDTLASNAALHTNSDEVTIIRIVGTLLYQHERDTGGFTNSNRSNFYAGITCLHEDVSTPSPLVDMAEEHWMWSGMANAQATFTQFPIWNTTTTAIVKDSTTQATSHVTGNEKITFDVRSMRKAPEPCKLILTTYVDEVMTETGASHFVSGLVRILCKV